MNLINKESGYLIIEVLLAITILASLVCYFNEIMGTIFTEWEEKTKFISLQERGELSLNFLADYIRNSCEIHIDNADEIEIKAEYLDQGIKWIKFNIYTSKGSPTLGMKVGEEINDI